VPVARKQLEPVVIAANLIGITVPNFMLGVSLIFVLSVKLGLLTSTGWVPWSDGIGVHLEHLLMPVLTLSAFYFGTFSIVYRAEYQSVIRREYPWARRCSTLASPSDKGHVGKHQLIMHATPA